MKLRFRTSLLGVSLGIAAAIAGSARATPVDPGLPSYQPQAFEHRSGARYLGADGSIRVIGAEHVEHILKGFNDLFAQGHPGTRFTPQLKGTTTAMPALVHDVSAFAPMGREVNGVELVPYVKIVGQEPVGIRVAHAAHSTRPLATSLAVYVNKANLVDRLTVEQLTRIFTSGHPRGDINRWGQAGATGEWAGRAIHAYGTAAHSGFGDYMMKNVFEQRPFVRGYEEFNNTAAILKRVAEDPAGIGFAAIGRTDANLKVVALARTPGGEYSTGTADDVVSGKYPLARYLTFYVRRVPDKPVDPFVMEYFRLILSKEGQQIIADETDGYIPLTAKEAADEWAALQSPRAPIRQSSKGPDSP